MPPFKGINLFRWKKSSRASVEAKNAEPTPEDQAAAAVLAAREAALPGDRQGIYHTLKSIRSELRSMSRKAARERAADDRDFHSFALSYAETPSLDMSRYAADPESFSAIKERFKLSVFMLDTFVPYEPGREYTRREGSAKEPLSGKYQYLDAPYAFALGYQKDDGTWEVLSTISFIPDYAKKVILVDQLQGGDTAHDRASKEGKRVRMKFKMPPEEIMYEAVVELARRAGYRGVALRKSTSNQWSKVQQPKVPPEERRRTPYDRVASSRKLRGFAHGDYHLEPITLRAAGDTPSEEDL